MEDAPPSMELVAYRLGRVEKAVEMTNQKLELIAEISDKVAEHSWRVASLERSRDRLIAAVATIATGVVMIAIQQVFHIL